MEKTISNSKTVENQDYFESVVLFSMFVENVSLFSQFLVIMSFNKYKNVLKGISNAVEATSKEENIHAGFGFDLVNIIKKENPSWWSEQLVEDLIKATKDAYEAEEEIVDWIFENGDLPFLTKDVVKEFVKHRFNESLVMIGAEKHFDVDMEKLKDLKWFEDEIHAEVNTDFFHKKPVTYSKFTKSFTAEDLF